MAEVKDKIKAEITIEEVRDIVEALGGEPKQIVNSMFVSQAISHGSTSYKLYYYQNSEAGIFVDYSGDDYSFDIFELIEKVKGVELREAINYVVTQIPRLRSFAEEENQSFFIETADFEYLNTAKKLQKKIKNQFSTDNNLKVYKDVKFLKNLPRPLIKSWSAEGIDKKVLDLYEIAYNAKNGSIVIPHYDIENNLVGIRERTLIKEMEETYGKYIPMKGYAHPLGLNLYGIHLNQNNIMAQKKAILVEGEKSVYKLESILGAEGNIAVAVCGSNITGPQIGLLMDLGVNEIAVAFDKQYNNFSKKDEECVQWMNKLEKIYEKYHNYINLSFVIDKNGLLGYKDSPCDCGSDTFLTLYKNRVTPNKYGKLL